MKKIVIKKIKNEDTNIYRIPSLSLKDSENTVKMQIPHPAGNSTLDYQTLEEAILAIKHAGYEYVIPEGEFVSEQEIRKIQSNNSKSDELEELIYDKLVSKVDDINKNIASSAIKGLALLNNSKAIDVFLDKLGEDNDTIRNSAIEALAEYENDVVDLLIDALIDENWVKRNSAITCLVKISESAKLDVEKIMVPLINRFDDANPIVQANALLAAAKIYTNSMSND